LIENILSQDRHLFRLINSEWTNPFFTWLMPWLRNSNLWFPLYLFLILFVAVNFKKTGWWWIAFAVCTVILTDFVSSTLIKENIWRLRPCNNPDLSAWINVRVGYRPQSSSFTSSHAANHFGLATFLFLTLRKIFGKWTGLFFLWALGISYAQVYVGVHYPLDIVGGTGIGIVIGYLSGRSFNKNYGLT
jgi:membrane-associated phospholipid phosphatase